MSSANFLEKLLDGIEVEWMPLGKVAKYSDSRIDSTQVNQNNYVGVDNLLQNRAGKLSSSYVPTEGRLIEYRKGDILIGNIRPYLKKIWLANNFGGASGDVLVIRSTHKALSSEYLHQVLTDDKFFAYNMQHAKGAKMPRGDKAKILEYSIPVPCPDTPKKSLEIQAEIVRILDAMTAHTAELTAELTTRKKQYNYYRDKLLSFDDGEVEWKLLGDIIYSLKTGLNPRQNFQLNTPDSKGYYVTVREIQNGRVTFLEKTDRVNERALKLINGRSNLDAGDVLFSGTGTVGRTAVIEDKPENWNIKEGVYVIKPMQDKISPRYLAHLLSSSEIVKEYSKKIVGNPVVSLPMGDLRNLKIPVLPLDKQARLVAILDKFDVLTTSITEGLPREIELRQKQYAYYRDLLLSFPQAQTA